VEHLSGAKFFDRLLAFFTNIRLGWRGLPVKNTLLDLFVSFEENKVF
jgi:hypothetical protein